MKTNDLVNSFHELGFDIDQSVGNHMSLRDLCIADNVARRMGIPVDQGDVNSRKDNQLYQYIRYFND